MKDGTRALKMYQQQHQVLCGSPPMCRRQRFKVQFACDCAGRFRRDLHGKTARRLTRSALYLTVNKVAGGGTSAGHALCTFASRNSQHGEIKGPTPYILSGCARCTVCRIRPCASYRLGIIGGVLGKWADEKTEPTDKLTLLSGSIASGESRTCLG